ncbi:MAG TPA: hypothetical protein VGL70_12595 [Candidatus Binatia bacterium]
MKNQYVGDINDFRKYSLIRVLTGEGELRSGVCWMLTANDGRTDGRFLRYLQQPDHWRSLDKKTFEAMRRIVHDHRRRDVSLVEGSGVLPNAKFFSPILDDDRERRALYFANAKSALCGTQLLFFDPDNGLEVKSVPLGRKRSRKYLYWSELPTFSEAGCSILIYQHFPREDRASYIQRRVVEIWQALGDVSVYSFRTAYVGFFLAAQSPSMRRFFRERVKILERRWNGQFQVQYHGNG